MTLVQKEIKKVTIRPNGSEVQIRPEIPLITTPGIYHSPSLGLISLSSDGTNWITIADKNLGATQVYNDGDTLSEVNCGKYYQWGNNYGFPFTGAVTTSSTKVSAAGYYPGNYYSSSTFITTNPRWNSGYVSNLWGGVTGTVEAMQGPCDEGYHIPSRYDWQSIDSVGESLGIWSGTGGGNAMKSYLKMPFSGMRGGSDSYFYGQGTYGRYWTVNQVNSGDAYMWQIQSNYSFESQESYIDALPIRPFANTPVQPDDSWTVLYQ